MQPVRRKTRFCARHFPAQVPVLRLRTANSEFGDTDSRSRLSCFPRKNRSGKRVLRGTENSLREVRRGNHYAPRNRRINLSFLRREHGFYSKRISPDQARSALTIQDFPPGRFPKLSELDPEAMVRAGQFTAICAPGRKTRRSLRPVLDIR